MKSEAKLVTDFFLPSNCFILTLGQAFFWNWNINQFYTLNLGACARPTYCQATLFRFLWRKRFVPHTKKQQLTELKSIHSTMWVAYPQAIKCLLPTPWNILYIEKFKTSPFLYVYMGLLPQALLHPVPWIMEEFLSSSENPRFSATGIFPRSFIFF